MRKRLVLLAVATFACAKGPAANPDMARWEATARNVTIVRDDHGIAHVHGKTDADAVFGMVYAQAEDDFNRIETNFINAQGRLAEAEGEGVIWRDLRMKLFIDTTDIKAKYDASPVFLKALMDAWADGLNFYLAKHPDVHPRVITKFAPWMALTFSEGSIGGDIESVSLSALEAFYGKQPEKQLTDAERYRPREPSGSNGIAIAGANTASGKAMLLINPHTSFFFRSELQVTSDEGLNAYGAATWGQFFIYQGFNEHAGWMHTTSGADVIDEYAETVTQKGDTLTYKYGTEERPVTATKITIPYKTASGMAKREFTVYRTHHGPVVREAGGKWIAVRLMQEPVKALTQSYTRTKATNLKSFRETMELHTNSSNNTVFADGEGHIALFLANYVAKRDPRFDWSKPVDGSNPATEWQGIHSIDESPNSIDPANGWVQNTNNWPYSAAGPNSPKAKDFAAYFDRVGENPRGVHAIRVLDGHKGFTLDSLIHAAYDSYLTGFVDLVPALLRDYDRLPASSPQKKKLADQVAALRGWDLRWSAASVPTSLAVFWGEDLWQRVKQDAESEQMSVFDFITKKATSAQRLASLEAASDKLTQDFGTWKTPWGDINRFQRINGDLVQPFDDSKPSIPVPFTSSRWGSLASFGARPYPGTKKIYGTNGNSFVAVVEFGDSVRAKAVTAGGESGHVESKHFNDQAEAYANGALRDVYFYPNQLAGHTEREYRPGT